MSGIAEQRAVRRGAATAIVHESYSFACMRCGHGWEMSYEIEHHTDAEGHDVVMYVVGDRVVPSPLSRPACLNCDGHVVRIMRAGQVSSAREAAGRARPPARTAPAADPAPAGPEGAARSEATVRTRTHHHWHLSDLLHPFRRTAG